MFAKLVVEPSTAFILAGNCLARVEAVELRIAAEVWGREQLLCVTDHMLVNHAGGNFVARRA